MFFWESKQLRKQKSGKLHYLLNFLPSLLAHMESWFRDSVKDWERNCIAWKMLFRSTVGIMALNLVLEAVLIESSQSLHCSAGIQLCMYVCFYYYFWLLVFILMKNFRVLLGFFPLFHTDSVHLTWRGSFTAAWSRMVRIVLIIQEVGSVIGYKGR